MAGASSPNHSLEEEHDNDRTPACGYSSPVTGTARPAASDSQPPSLPTPTVHGPSLPRSQVDVPHNWNPLTDDGDALRLAVKLGVQPIFQNGKVFTGYERTEKYEKPIFESLTGDQYGATRRAIVRAAAALAKDQPT